MKNRLSNHALPFFRKAFCSCAALLLAAACGDATEGAGGFEAGDSVPVAPETKEAIVVIDGMAEPMTLRRYESPAEAPHAFSTYLPEGIEAVESGAASPSGEWGVRFVTSPPSGSGGAAVEVVFLPAGTSEEEGRARVSQAAGTTPAGVAARPTSTRWGLVEHRYHDEEMDGSVMLGQYGDRFFELLIRYPREWGDGFLPRAAWILEEWMWEDSGEALQSLQGF